MQALTRLLTGLQARGVRLEDVDPELRRAAGFLPRGGNLKRGLRVPRATMALAGMVGGRRDVPTERVSPGVTVRVHRPAVTSTPGAAVVWIHGGGYVLGSAKQEDVFCARLATQTGAAVVAVDYRLAPEHPYPVPVDDCYDALRWAADQPWVDADRIVVGGASAGGGLAAAVALLARDRGDVRLAGQLLVYPMLDDRTGRDGEPGRRIMWGAPDNGVAWDWYLAGADRDVAVPARRDDLAGLPPVWIGVGSLDLFHAEDLAYAARLTEAGVACTVEDVPGAYHAFDMVVVDAAVSRGFFESQCAFIREVTS